MFPQKSLGKFALFASPSPAFDRTRLYILCVYALRSEKVTIVNFKICSAKNIEAFETLFFVYKLHRSSAFET